MEFEFDHANQKLNKSIIKAFGKDDSHCVVNYVLNNQMITGDYNGSLWLWNGKSAKEIKAHQGAVNCIRRHATAGYYYSSGADGTLCQWDKHGGKTLIVNLYAEAHGLSSQTRQLGITAFDPKMT